MGSYGAARHPLSRSYARPANFGICANGRRAMPDLIFLALGIAGFAAPG